MTAPVVVLPPSEINWIITQPESSLSAQEMHRDQLQSDWTFLNQNIVKYPIHQDVIRGNMVRKLDSFTEPVMEELQQCFDDYWGMSTEWHEVNIWDSMMKVFARTSNRMFVGLPLCRNEDFLDGCRGFAQDVMVSTAILTMMPGWLKPVLGYLAIAPNYWHYRKSAKYLIPLIESRLEIVRSNPEKVPADLLPNDLVTWSIIEAQKSSDSRELTLELLAKRTMTVNMAAIHTSTMTSTNLLVDLLSSNPKLGYLEALASEIETISQTYHGDWSKAALAAMTRTDSALRESMRVSGFVVWGVERKVVAKDGVVLPDGTKMPHGANIGVAAWDNHHDEKVYPKPFEYDALRFSRQREQLGGQQVHVGEEGLVEGEQGWVLRRILRHRLTCIDDSPATKAALRLRKTFRRCWRAKI
jgi:cytochrome P450